MSLQDLLTSVAKPFAKQFPDSNVKFQLAKDELPPTGLVVDNPLLEYILDRRFLAYGRFYLLYGKKGNAKTSLLFDLFKLFIRNGGDAVWIETEHARDLDYAKRQGIDVDGQHFSVLGPETLQEGLTMARQLIEGYAAKYPEGDGPPLIIGFDSIAGTMTQYEQEANQIGEVKIGEHAKLCADFYRKVAGPLSSEKIIFVALNQLRAKIGGMASFGAEEQEAMLGGEAPRFSSTYQLKTVRTKDLIGKNEFGVERKVGSRHEVTAKRNKLGREGNSQKIEYDLYIDGGIDWYSPLIRMLADEYKDLMVKESGGWYRWKVANTEYFEVVAGPDGTTTTVPGIIDTELKMREADMGRTIMNSPAAKDLIRKYFQIQPMPTETEIAEVEKENKKKRKSRKKDEDSPAVKAL